MSRWRPRGCRNIGPASRSLAATNRVRSAVRDGSPPERPTGSCSLLPIDEPCGSVPQRTFVHSRRGARRENEEGKRDVTDIAGGGGAEDGRLRLVAPANSGNTMVNPWLRSVIFGRY